MKSWTPHVGPQEKALKQSSNILEILFGGSRGPGKTDAGMVWLLRDIDNPLLRGLVIRRNADDLSDWIDRAHRMFFSIGVKIAYRPAILTFPSGAVIRTGHLKDEQAYTKYVGHEYQRMLIEELTQIPNEKRYIQLLGSLRSTVPNLKPQAFLTTNPGGVGHAWVKKRFIDVAPPNTKFVDPASGLSRIFIPATIDDNPTLFENDPNYVRFLESLRETDEELWKAWRLGDWNIFAGQAFREFRYDVHVIDPSKGYTFDYKLSQCKRFIAFDWGYNAPGCASWLAITPENKFGVRHVYVYRELYQREKHPEEWANDLKMINLVDPVRCIYMPHDTFNRESGESIAEIFRRTTGIRVERGDTLARGARRNRLALTHRALAISDDGLPFMQIHPNCRNLIRTLPELVYAENNPEDIDTDGEDHCLAGETPILTSDGWQRLDKLDGVKVTGYDAKVIKLITEDDKELICTPNHKILTPTGWQEAQHLKVDSLILWSSLAADNLMRAKTSTYAVSTFNAMAKGYIEKSGKITMARIYRRAFTSIIQTVIGLITPLRILNAYPSISTSAVILPHPPTNNEKPVAKMPSAHAEPEMTALLKNNEVKRLKRVIDDGYRDKVYDITILDNLHAFIANGFIVHNSYDSVSLGLMMEAPSFDKSGGVARIPKGPQFKRTFTPMRDGSIKAPDFWEGFKEKQRPTKWHK